jgi:hypothetical protein
MSREYRKNCIVARNPLEARREIGNNSDVATYLRDARVPGYALKQRTPNNKIGFSNAYDDNT